eukprot:m.382870 g.382870  ORF g.382870 m.382870 type:complete len:53 (+) comp20976_c0_seq22:1904-2062(+)
MLHSFLSFAVRLKLAGKQRVAPAECSYSHVFKQNFCGRNVRDAREVRAKFRT